MNEIEIDQKKEKKKRRSFIIIRFHYIYLTAIIKKIKLLIKKKHNYTKIHLPIQ